MKTYFKECTTLEDVKTLYKDLFLANRDNSHIMTDINNEFDSAFEAFKDVFKDSKGKIYKSVGKPVGTPKEWIELIKNLSEMKDIDIELCGTWLWVTGETKRYKDRLKELKFNYAGDKKAWSYHNEPFRKKSKKRLSLNDIRTTYGTQKIEKDAE